MIGRLRGVVVGRESDGTCVVDVGGVGYEVLLPVRSARGLPAAPEQVSLFVHTHVREDALTLFAFASVEDRAVFRALLGVASVGPRIALAILGHLSASDLVTAVARGDKSRFKGISGVGKKTVERLVLELKDKLPAVASATRPSAAPAREAPGLPEQRAIVANALVHLGYRKSEAETAAGKIPDGDLDKPVEELLRKTLLLLG
ncbi:MAG: Holliday junction branch migration protein RuvA [Proteobacteria bacterium]|nr:Holliday junction branch migration protein RuvA [Pseudomonadota bacterium]